MNLSKLLAFALVISATPILYAQTTPTQTWFTVTAENPSIAVVLPAGTTYRFGDSINNLWSAPITVPAATTFSPVDGNYGVFPFPDPDDGTVKELDVLETSATQVIAVNNLSNWTSASLTVPAIVQAVTTTPPSTPSSSSNWFTITQESGTVAVLLPAGATYRIDHRNRRDHL
jgi:hypothetical protein